MIEKQKLKALSPPSTSIPSATTSNGIDDFRGKSVQTAYQINTTSAANDTSAMKKKSKKKNKSKNLTTINNKKNSNCDNNSNNPSSPIGNDTSDDVQAIGETLLKQLKINGSIRPGKNCDSSNNNDTSKVVMKSKQNTNKLPNKPTNSANSVKNWNSGGQYSDSGHAAVNYNESRHLGSEIAHVNCTESNTVDQLAKSNVAMDTCNGLYTENDTSSQLPPNERTHDKNKQSRNLHPVTNLNNKEINTDTASISTPLTSFSSAPAASPSDSQATTSTLSSQTQLPSNQPNTLEKSSEQKSSETSGAVNETASVSQESISPSDIKFVEYENELQMPDIMRVIQKDLSEPYSIYTYRYFIHNWPKLCFLAMHEDKCIGAIVCKLDIHRQLTKRGYIAMLAVDKDYRKLKVGTTLVQKAIYAMLEYNADEVVLETEITNIPALRLYENLGFVRDKRLFDYYLNGVDALRLKLWFK